MIQVNDKGQFVVSVEGIYLGTVMTRRVAEVVERVGSEYIAAIPQGDRAKHQGWTTRRVQRSVAAGFARNPAYLHHGGMVPYTQPSVKCLDQLYANI